MLRAAARGGSGEIAVRFFPRAAVAIAVGALMALPGCGGGGGSSAVSTASSAGALSKQAFVARVNGYCARLKHQLLGPKLNAYRREQQRDLQQGRQPRSAASFFRDTVAPGIRRLIQRIRSLPPPAGDENQVNAILAAADRTVGQIESDPSGVVRVNPPFVVEFKSRTLDQAGVLARRYGLDRCGPSKH
jgi:hypothetical protein